MSPSLRRLGTPAVLLATLLLCAHSFSQSKGASVGDSDVEALVRLRKEIVGMIGEPTCANLVYCRVLALGVKPCGQPEEYLAYSSTAKTNEDMLGVKAAEYAFLQEEAQMANPPPGPCAVPPKPRVQCVDQRCKLQPQ
jgi:hypothetical protein